MNPPPDFLSTRLRQDAPCLGTGRHAEPTAARSTRDQPGGWKQRRLILPVTGALLASIIFLLRSSGHIGQAWIANGLVYLPILALAFIITAWLGSVRTSMPDDRRWTCILFWCATIGGACGFTLTGLYFTQACGPHAGDEGHYLIQAESLYYDGDLDIKNNLINEVGEENIQRLGLDYFHISPGSHGGHWYSLHAAGLPLLLAPVVGGGAVARHMVLGLIAGLAGGAMVLLCRRAGASAAATAIVLSAFWFSVYWCVYCSRCLPEVLGAGLTAWLGWCILVQAEYPRRSVTIAAICCAGLPWAHLRFYPIGLAGLLLYIVYGLRGSEPRSAKAGRLLAFGLLATAGIVFFHVLQRRMFAGGFSHDVGHMLFSTPAGAWRIFTDQHGLFTVLPLALWLTAANGVWLLTDSARRGPAFVLLMLFSAGWLTACTTPTYPGGAALSGRFLVAVMPLLLPGAAVMWEHAPAGARWWFLCLALFSIALCILELWFLPELGRSFAFPTSEIPNIAPVWRGLRSPVSNAPLALALWLATMILIALPPSRQRLSIWLAAGMLALAIAGHLAGGATG